MTCAVSSETSSEPSGITSTSTGRPPGLVVGTEPAVSDGLVADSSVAVDLDDGEAKPSVTGLGRTIPRAVLRDEDLVAILGREHRPGVEGHPD